MYTIRLETTDTEWSHAGDLLGALADIPTYAKAQDTAYDLAGVNSIHTMIRIMDHRDFACVFATRGYVEEPEWDEWDDDDTEEGASP